MTTAPDDDAGLCPWCDGTGTIVCARGYLGPDGAMVYETWFEGICGACGGSGLGEHGEQGTGDY